MIPKVQSGVLFSADRTTVVVWERSCQANGVDGGWRLEVLFMGMGACDCA